MYKRQVIRGGTGAIVYLKDIAEVKDTYKEQESYARLNKKNVLSLNVIKRSGENLIITSDKILSVSYTHLDVYKRQYPITQYLADGSRES